MKQKNIVKTIAFITGIFFCISTYAQSRSTSLLNDFINPPASARPRVWWHWMNGNITKDGIRKDLMWMHRAGIGGFHNFDAALYHTQIVNKRLMYMTPEWKDAFRFTTKLADSLRLEMAIAGSPGWSESGGPWVSAKDGMKKLVWSEMRVKGGQAFTGVVSKPPTVSGTFQNVSSVHALEVVNGKTIVPLQYYQDISVIAYRVPSSHLSINELAPKITSSSGTFTLEQLTDGDLATTSLLPSATANDFGWIQFTFEKPQPIKAIAVTSVATKGTITAFNSRYLQSSDDGVNFQNVIPLPQGEGVQQTFSIPPITAKYFRMTFKNPRRASNVAILGEGEVTTPIGTDIAEVVLYPYSVVDHFEEKAGFIMANETNRPTKADVADAINPTEIIDLTGKMIPDGRLNWIPPAGSNWKIIRFGYSLTGKQNEPASPEATGLEVDKLDATAVAAYFENYLAQYKDATGGLMGSKGGLQYMVTDSWEAKQANWTPKMPEEFKKRRGYSLVNWMPVLTGEIVKSAEESEKFLWDFRKTIAELVTENHYGQLTRLLAKYGMKRYTESHEIGRAYLFDGMDVKRTAAIPMSAMWVNSPAVRQFELDIRESASVAHIYGQNLVAAESLTADGTRNAYSYSPEKLKPTADRELASGLNRFVIHTSVHQPVDDKVPGLGLGQYGQWFNRHETWAEQAKAWTDYLARSSYMLQQGTFVADVVYYYGEDNNITNLFKTKAPDIPEGYSYDFINPHALINLLSVKNGKLVTPSGMNYSLLVLDSNARKMSLPVLRKIHQLVKAGATVSGVVPESTPSLQDDPSEFQRLVAEVWGTPKTLQDSRIGTVYTGKTIQKVLTELSILPDFEHTKSQNDTKLLYVHRKLNEGDIYWVNNRNDRNETVEATFRVSGKVPWIWHPETGKSEPASYNIKGGRTTVSLHLNPNDAIFVVFQEPALKTTFTRPETIEKEVKTVAGPWKVSFQPDRGAPPVVTFDSLTSWSGNTTAGIKYFSGTASYTKTIKVSANQLGKGKTIWIDLGVVKNLAQVVVNGKSLGVVWKKPFRVDVTNALKAGDNTVEIKVTNLWVNRLIGDAQPETKEKITYTTMPFYKGGESLLPSGLLGPVKLVVVE